MFTCRVPAATVTWFWGVGWVLRGWFRRGEVPVIIQVSDRDEAMLA